MASVLACAGCSPWTNVIAISSQGLIAYASGSNILVSSLRGPDPGIWRLLSKGPNGEIHSVFIHEDVGGNDGWIFAGSSDGRLCSWKLLDFTPGPTIVLDTAIAVFTAIAEGDGKIIIQLHLADIKGRFYRFALREGQFSQLDRPLGFGLCKVISIAVTKVDDEIISLLGLSDNTLTIMVNGKVSLVVPGHTNWITSISVLSIKDTCIVATGSTDRTVRLWKIAPREDLDTRAKLLELVPRKNSFNLKNAAYEIECMAILYGHEEMVNSVSWNPSTRTLTTSGADHTIIRWKEGTDGVWQSILQIGDISSLGTVGSDRSFGFYSAILTQDVNDKEAIIAHGSTGSIVAFALQSIDDAVTVASTTLIASGHVGTIEGCEWEPENGLFLATVGVDKTCRTWMPSSKYKRLIEIARPQIHGYEMRAVGILDERHILSIGDEKILRSFEAPISFLQRTKMLDGLTDSDLYAEATVFVPALGLSNKQVDEDLAQGVTFEAPLNRPPTEYDLSRLTLWKETDKLYGHGHELFSIAIHPSKKLAASASKATTKEDAAIRLWIRQEDDTWKPHPQGPILVHGLTVTRLAFSHNGRWLLSVSRDRQCALLSADGESCKLLQIQAEAHGRIIWSADWSRGDDFFVTGSRDKTLKTWRIQADGDNVTFAEDVSYRLEFPTPVTALTINCDNRLAVGCEDGSIYIYQYGSSSWNQLTDHLIGGAPDSVKDLKWHPKVPLLAATSSVLQVFTVLEK